MGRDRQECRTARKSYYKNKKMNLFVRFLKQGPCITELVKPANEHLTSSGTESRCPIIELKEFWDYLFEKLTLRLWPRVHRQCS